MSRVGLVTHTVQDYFNRMVDLHHGFDRYDGLSTTFTRVTQCGRVDFLSLDLDVVEDQSSRDGRMINGLRTLSLSLKVKDLPDVVLYLLTLAYATMREDYGEQQGVMGVPSSFKIYQKGLENCGERLKDGYFDSPHTFFKGDLEDISQYLVSGGSRFTHIAVERRDESRLFGCNVLSVFNGNPSEDVLAERGEKGFRYELKHTLVRRPWEIVSYAKVFDDKVLGVGHS